MNKTININLAGIFFHVDEDAYLKLQNYLEAVKRSFASEQGHEEILSDIEARIAELFNERIQNERQVIGNKEVDEIINIMGQPEDYNVGEESYEESQDATTRKKITRKLFRDPTNAYAGGVSSGLGYYFGIDPIWIRIFWVVFTLGSSGTFFLIYISLWIFVPKAVSTADQLAMRGEAINISNIEKKIKEGFENVSDHVKNADYAKYGDKVKSTSSNFFEGLSEVLRFCLKLIGKAVGLLLLFVSGISIISLLLALFDLTTFNIFDAPWIDYVDVVNVGAPLWLISLLVLLVVGIPFFFIFILGLKILIENLKSIGKTAKIVLVSLWFIALAGLTFLGVKQASERAFDARVTATENLYFNHTDTLNVKMLIDDRYVNEFDHSDGFNIRTNENNEQVIVLQDIRINVKSTQATTASIQIAKNAQGNSYENAKNRAETLKYNYQLTGNTLLLDAFALSEIKSQFRDQKITVTLHLPVGMTLYADGNTYDFNTWSSHNNNIPIKSKENQYLKIDTNSVHCLNCNEHHWDAEYEDNDDSIDINFNSDDDEFNLHIDENGIRMKSKN
ncbi:PspC domain-containing protein [Aquimarina agarivorans]|uniref:PspC domain-containing protein n=1 Tax=Aquimarina agarivorans TaxID=980584 RepID=UPI000248EA5B|nr:PspC domain-containing protein [Aquimarina agarivorans]